MIEFQEYVLSNGMHVVFHQDMSTPLVAVNMLYKVGSRNEVPERTGFAHLFEHLMFSGSKHVVDFDIPVQMAGGENNAFTNSDITNFYNIAPKENLETLLWLESDRMAYLNINEKSLGIQKKVVVEEFKEVCLNQPYGNMWHHMSALAYKKHPYQWPTIGKDFSHIAEAKLGDVQHFFKKYYRPSNAILSISGPLEFDDTIHLIEKWFGDIESGPSVQDSWNYDDPQIQFQQLILQEEVPAKAIFMGFHMADRLSREYMIADLISDILANGRSSRFYSELYKKSQLFTTIDAYISGTIDPGLLVVEAKLKDHKSIEESKSAIWKVLNHVKENKISQTELEKLINKVESAYLYGEINVLHKAINLAYFAHIGQTNLINEQVDLYKSVRVEEIQEVANQIFQEKNCSEIIYLPKDV